MSSIGAREQGTYLLNPFAGIKIPDHAEAYFQGGVVSVLPGELWEVRPSSCRH